MPSLQTLQKRMTAAIFKGDASPIEADLLAGRANAARRFMIYRNNTFLSLGAHLKAMYPVTAELGDERFFAYAANEFVHRHPPREPRLAHYGDEFSRFLATFPACRFAPVLAQMAALEWAVHAALTSPERPSIAMAALTDLEAAAVAGFELQPSLHFSVSRWPLLGLWARRKGIEKPLARKPTRVAVLRHGDDIRFFELSAARFAFWRALSRKMPIERAAHLALSRDPFFDMANEVLTLFGSGLVTAITYSNQPH